MEIHLRIIGLILMALALVHVIFPRYFDWANDLKPLSAINRQMMYVHTLFIAIMVFMMGALCFTSWWQLEGSYLGHKIALGFSIFWMIRLLIQFFGYSSDLWRGKRFETVVHVLFSFMWLYFSAVFWMVYWHGRAMAE